VEKLQQVPLRHAPLLKQSPLAWHVSPAIDLLVHMPAVKEATPHIEVGGLTKPLQTEEGNQEDSHPFEQLAAAAASSQQNPLLLLVPPLQRPDAHISD
jgi:hypothetical protein